MDNKNIVINISSITNIQQMMDSECNKLIEMINKYKDMFEEIRNIYDTESGLLYRTIAIGYLGIVNRYLSNDFKEYINQLDSIKKAYIDEINAVSNDVHGGTI